MLFTELNRNCSALPSWKWAADTSTQALGLRDSPFSHVGDTVSRQWGGREVQMWSLGSITVQV